MSDTAARPRRLRVRVLRALPPERRRALEAAARVARRLGMPVYLIGGSIRDLLLGEPSPDLDLTVVGDGIAFARVLAQEVEATVIEERRFLTAKIETPDGTIDVATARRETYPRPGALPQVEPGTIADDLARRDFTVNAMALRLDGRGPQRLLDPFGGRDDLKRRCLRVLHDRSFHDDPTRILRAARYAARLGFRLEPKTRRLAQEAVRAECLDTVSRERLRRELFLLLDEAYPWAGVNLCARLGALRALHPGLTVAAGTHAACERTTAICRWLARRRGTASPDAALARLLVIADPLSAVQGRALSERLRLTARERTVLLAYLQQRTRLRRILSAPGLRPSTLVRALEGLPLEAVVALAATSSRRVTHRCRLFLRKLRGVGARIKGHDLARLGFEPSPAWAKALQAARDARLDGGARQKEDELRIAARVLRAHEARGAGAKMRQ